MKKVFCLLLVVMVVLALVTPVNLYCQEEEPEEEEPVQARPNPMAWVQLAKMEPLKTLQIKEIQKGRTMQFNMNNIKQALGKAKIREKVSIFYVGPTGDTYHLGTYAPGAVRVVKKRPGSGKNPVLINPQPEPPRYRNIPMVKQAVKGAPVLVGPAAAKFKGKALLIFKNAKGQIKATIQLRQSFMRKVKPKGLLRSQQ